MVQSTFPHRVELQSAVPMLWGLLLQTSPQSHPGNCWWWPATVGLGATYKNQLVRALNWVQLKNWTGLGPGVGTAGLELHLWLSTVPPVGNWPFVRASLPGLTGCHLCPAGSDSHADWGTGSSAPLQPWTAHPPGRSALSGRCLPRRWKRPLISAAYSSSYSFNITFFFLTSLCYETRYSHNCIALSSLWLFPFHV